jgi:hypothetical protein
LIGNLTPMHPPLKQRLVNFIRTLGIVIAAFALMLLCTLIWYEVTIEIPAVHSLQQEVLYQNGIISILSRISSSAREPTVQKP